MPEHPVPCFTDAVCITIQYLAYIVLRTSRCGGHPAWFTLQDRDVLPGAPDASGDL